MVRVQWGGNPTESMWETKEKMKASHPELFSAKLLS